MLCQIAFWCDITKFFCLREFFKSNMSSTWCYKNRKTKKSLTLQTNACYFLGHLLPCGMCSGCLQTNWPSATSSWWKRWTISSEKSTSTERSRSKFIARYVPAMRKFDTLPISWLRTGLFLCLCMLLWTKTCMLSHNLPHIKPLSSWSNFSHTKLNYPQ